MKVRTITLLICWTTSVFGAQVIWSAGARKTELDQVAVWESKLAELKVKSGEERIKGLRLGLRNLGYRKTYIGHSSEVDRVYLELQSEILIVPGHARYFADDIRTEQRSVRQYPMNTGPRISYDRHRALNFETFSHLPSPGTIAVLGEFLSDDIDTPTVLISPDSDWGENPRANSYHSSWAVMNIGLRNPPVAKEDKEVNLDERLANTRSWWEEIKVGNQAFSFVGQNVEYRFNPDGTWQTIAISNPPDDGPGRPVPISGERPEKRQHLAVVVEHPEPISNWNAWAWVSGAAAALAALLTWFFLNRRKV